MVEPRRVASRELDGLPFVVVILRVQDGVADVAYLDDGNVECGVPLDELDVASGAEAHGSGVDPDRCWEDSLAWLEAEEERERAGAPASRPATASTMHWDDGRYVAEDGAVIVSNMASERPPPPRADDLEKATGPAACGTGLRGIRCLRKRRVQVQHAQVVI
mmetsp:Transcript_98083/g.277763  ORF Transcript_98083/g.277763 Transcript_98083/m.277763 type:complete len:162 (+) Transcript_98083:96-581(+)|eukprot:CAMPEP_0168405094 /NCGR_PEP_ID=MMETSP0228-20121227/24967_1 /TAXON_ID=133427 /ORGANISM="Protoceratium reticulatum, Strain CCCM 535 (=CCMP 1889)" /LENGTH=161 /DNA_ID=CAMNT_0008418717 /DNA_START=3 /DNA_END=488 /DNA_ORIENTATION=-